MRKPLYCLVMVLLVSLMLCGSGRAAGLINPEAASSSEQAAKYQVRAIYEGTDLRIVQFYLGVLSHYSYLLISDGKVLAVDPGRDVKALLDYAAAEKLDWVGTFLTHLHADFVAGHIEMALATGRPVYAGYQSAVQFPHIEVRDGSNIEVGKALIRIIETPGHTPDALCGLVMASANHQKHEYLFSGDSLFNGGPGRPDLIEGSHSAAELASMMFDTWNKKLALLKDNVVLLPAHDAGFFKRSGPGDLPSSTIGQERKTSCYLKNAGNRSAFISRFMADYISPPGYYSENARINRVGPEIVNWKATSGPEVENLKELMKSPEVYVVDVRNENSYAASHIPGSVNIALRGRFETWTGTIVPFKSRLVLTGSPAELEEASLRLKRVGYNAEYIVFADYVSAGGMTVSTRMMTAAELRQKMLLGQAPVMLDVRMPEEWQQIRIGEMVNIPLEFLEMQVRKRLDAEEPLLVICDSSFRSSLAIGLLERLSFKSPTVLRGGLEAWINAGFPLDTSETKPSSPGTHALSVPSASSAFRNLKLPERISVAQLLQMNRDLPGTFEIIDIRPAEQVADYNPTGASQVDLGDLLESSTWLAGEIPLVIVDRDGSLAMIAAGILSRKTSRPIKALLGGIESFWRTTGMNLKIYQTPAPFSRPVPEGSDDIPENRSIPGSTGSGEISPSRLPVSPDIESPGSAKKGGGC